MYAVDGADEVLKFDGVPCFSAGAPMPQVLANDCHLVLAYEIAPAGKEYAVVKFVRPYAHYFGLPNDETVHGHPLAKRGLGPYGVFEIRNSSWIRALERINSVHPNHDPRRFEALRHFVFTFHDNTFECVASDALLATTIPNEIQAIESLPSLMTNHMR
jgi:hypothetical protein